ncbi:MAG TPA: DUF3857 domain-containing protein [Candidatus Binataceae bacterium]|nr:DUF3857 domain-containing protein [Candidatus Binataceae bacterium]
MAAAAVMLNALPASAAPSKVFAGDTKYLWYHADYALNADGTHVENQAWAVKVLTKQGISSANAESVSFSDQLQKVTILEAYTLKPDGRKIDVPAGNFQIESNTGKAGAAPMFSDIQTETVAFPDVAVGDTVVLSYRLTQKEATFPGNFSEMETFSRFAIYDDVKISLSAPISLAVQVYARGVDGGETPTTDGRRRWVWSYRNQTLATPERGAVSEVDYGPLIVASTFKDYGALAAAYNARAKAKSAPTANIRKLANELTGAAHTPREQARALYDWVAANIDFAGDYVGVGSVVPHNVDEVLANRMGDCKDHAALLQSLLAAKGIASTPVLINAGAAYTLPKVPCLDAFDHVILYIPSLGLYADSTSKYTPFGSLPSPDAGKPVIYTADFNGLQHTPTRKWQNEGLRTTTVMTIHPDGSADGETDVIATGALAEAIRYRLIYLQPNMEDTAMRRALAVNGFTGTGVLNKGDATDIAESYKYGGKYTVSEAMNLPGPGAMYIRSPFGSDAGMTSFLDDANEPDRTVDFACAGVTGKVTYTIHLPKGIKVLAMPRNVAITGKYQSYKAAYHLNGDTLTAVREFDDRTAGPVCAPAVAVEYKKFAIAVQKDLHAQLLYE